MQICSLFTISVLCFAQLTLAAPAPAPAPAAISQDVGICIHYTYSAFDATNECLISLLPKPAVDDTSKCIPRVLDCIKKICKLPAKYTTAQLDACVAKHYRNLTPSSPIVTCVKGSVGSCPSYEWV